MENLLLVLLPLLFFVPYAIDLLLSMVHAKRMNRLINEGPKSIRDLLNLARIKLNSGAFNKLEQAIAACGYAGYERLSPAVLNKIYYAVNDIGNLGEFALIDAFFSAAGNPAEEALRFIDTYRSKQ